MKSGRLLIAGAVLCLVLPGCAVLGGGSSPLDTYELSAADTSESGPRRSRAQILIAEPSALKSLDGQNIVIKPGRGEIQYLKGAQWADRLPKVVQAKLAEAFQSTGRVGGVGKPGEGLAIDYQVITEVRAFEIRLDGGDHAYVELFVRILNDRNGTVRASRGFTAQSPVNGTGNPAYAAALDKAFQAATDEIVEWSLGRI
ncbi:MAG: ABC-type transport auxiliary lipoprotein family protein [Mesorhizobium sp.]|nr:ABC-type transport auxiliary lipoprotein family protein [Mesorhizobium sp.]MCO5164509.1 ABC-type transport auxiliary lipoprotein family protein [Mesorhizobium sp.]